MASVPYKQFSPHAYEFLPSAARTTTQTSDDIGTSPFRGVEVVFDVTANAVACSTVVTIDGKDEASGAWKTILTGAAVTGVTTNRYRIYPGLTAAANVDVSAPLPSKIRIVLTAGNANSATYSVGFNLLP